MGRHYELVAISARLAGESAAVMAANFTHRPEVVERDAPGGTVTHLVARRPRCCTGPLRA